MKLSHKVRFKRPFKDSGDSLEAWCLCHVGARYLTWDREIAHMDYETGSYMWVYSFPTCDAAVEFALAHVT